MSNDHLSEGDSIHLSAQLSGFAVQDTKDKPFAGHQSFWQESKGYFRLRVTLPFTHDLLRRLLGYGSEARVDAPSSLRQLIIGSLLKTTSAYPNETKDSDWPVLTISKYDKFSHIYLCCPVCRWGGKPDPEAFRWNDLENFPLEIFHCPNCSKGLLAIEQLPLRQTVLKNLDKLPEDERTDFLTQLRRDAERDAVRLKSPKQLPDIEYGDEPVTLIWDFEPNVDAKFDNNYWTVIRHDKQILWRQPSEWEGFSEFARIVDILQMRYSGKINDLTPTDHAMLWLTGDSMSSTEVIESARRSLGWKQVP